MMGLPRTCNREEAKKTTVIPLRGGVKTLDDRRIRLDTTRSIVTDIQTYRIVTYRALHANARPLTLDEL